MMPTATWPVTCTRAPAFTTAGSPPMSWYDSVPCRRIRQRGSTPASITPVSTTLATEAEDRGAVGLGVGDATPELAGVDETAPPCAQPARTRTAPTNTTAM